ncbi:MAG: ribose-5-phosphate isomerase RpiA [Trueperaceae bacterium]
MNENNASSGARSAGMNPTGVEHFKRQAALRALALVESGMLLGLGTGSTAKWLVEGLGDKLRTGELTDVAGVATSRQTEEQAAALGIRLTELPPSGVDLAIDGMDELAPGLDAIKGLGGALTREKIVAVAATRFVLIGDDSKYVSWLGQRAPVPVEVVPFGHQRTRRALEYLGAVTAPRMAGREPLVTDNGNLIYDCRFGAAGTEPFDAPTLALALAELPGVVEHGLFLGVADLAFVASQDGVAEHGREWRG